MTKRRTKQFSTTDSVFEVTTNGTKAKLTRPQPRRKRKRKKQK